MRIIAGSAGGLSLKTPVGQETRPTTDRVREALFSRLESYGAIAGATVLDLYAGAGSLGLEAASRGAHSVTLVDHSERAVQTLRENIRIVTARTPLNTRAVRSNVQSFLDSPRSRKGKVPSGGEDTGDGAPAAADLAEAEGWDLVFVDPPYSLTEAELNRALSALAPNLNEGAIVVVERSTRSAQPELPDALRLFAHKSYGETTLWFAEPSLEPN